MYGTERSGRSSPECRRALLPWWGGTVFLSTTLDSRFDLSPIQASQISDTQIPILSEVRFSDIPPGSSEEKSVLLPPNPQVAFEQVKSSVTFDPADLLVVIPGQRFYLREMIVKNGIELSLHGIVRDVRAGAGPQDLDTLMPSAFDRLSYSARLFGAIPAIAGLLLGILEKMGALGRK